jgi:hypothetical protein
MGLLRFLKSMVNPTVAFEEIVNTQARVFQALKEQHTERDRNAWLAMTIMSRPAWKGKDESVYFLQAAQFSLLPDDQAPVALGLWMAHHEFRQGGIPEPAQYEELFSRLMQPVYELTGNEFADRWGTANPWTAARHESMEAGLRAIGDRSVAE